MEVAGHTPCTAVYNVIIGAVASKGDFREALQIIRSMDRNGVAVDQYTISIMMKLTKQAKHPRDVEKLLALLDRQDVDIFQDCILLNTVLDALVYHQDSHRLTQ